MTGTHRVGGDAMAIPRRLVGKIAIITGAARGIGAAAARRLAAEGASVAVTDINIDGARATAAAIVKEGGAAKAYAIDVTQRGSVTTTVSAIATDFGRIDVLVNNAAVGKPVAFLDTSDEDLQRVLGVNLSGVFMVGQEVARIMAKQGSGRIVNVASLAAHTGNDRQSAYAAAKGGVVALTRVMAFELAPLGVCVNALSPGPIETELATAMLTPATRRAREVRVPMGRIGLPDEVAAAIAFLASSDASYVNGTVLVIDGGLLMGGIRE